MSSHHIAIIYLFSFRVNKIAPLEASVLIFVARGIQSLSGHHHHHSSLFSLSIRIPLSATTNTMSNPQHSPSSVVPTDSVSNQSTKTTTRVVARKCAFFKDKLCNNNFERKECSSAFVRATLASYKLMTAKFYIPQLNWPAISTLPHVSDLHGYSGLELMFANYSNKGETTHKLAWGRGRAIAVLNRWQLMSKFKEVQRLALQVKYAGLSTLPDGLCLEWIKQFGEDKAFDTHFEELVRLAEHVKPPGNVSERVSSFCHGDVSLYEKQRSVVKETMLALNRFNCAKRRNVAEIAYNELLFLFRKIWELEDRYLDPAAAGFEYKFLDEEDPDGLDDMYPSGGLVGNHVPRLAGAKIKYKVEDLYDSSTGDLLMDIDKIEQDDPTKAFVELCKADDRFIVLMRWKVEIVVPKHGAIEPDASAEIGSEQPSKKRRRLQDTNSASSQTSAPSASPALYISSNAANARVLASALEILRTSCPGVDRIPTQGIQKTKRVDLHVLAGAMLAEWTKWDSLEELISSDGGALRAIHVIALGLSGIMRKELKRQVSYAEQAAAGHVSASRKCMRDEVSIFRGEVDGAIPALISSSQARFLTAIYCKGAEIEIEGSRLGCGYSSSTCFVPPQVL